MITLKKTEGTLLDETQRVVDRNIREMRRETGPYIVTQNYTFVDYDKIDSLQVDATAQATTITLPLPTGNRRRRVIKTDVSANAVTVTANGVITINDVTTVTLTLPYEYIEVEPTGTAWLVVGRGTLYPVVNGIVFPATQVPSANPNTLDDYEEGTWTPGITFGGAAVGVTYTTQLGLYTKIGRLVFIQGRIVLSAKGSSTGNVLLTGLPFTSNANETLVFSGNGNNLVAGITSPVLFTLVVSATTVNVSKFSTGTYAALQDTDVNNNSVFNISGGYHT